MSARPAAMLDAGRPRAPSSSSRPRRARATRTRPAASACRAGAAPTWSRTSPATPTRCVNLLDLGAHRGAETPMYASPEQRAREIEKGAAAAGRRAARGAARGANSPLAAELAALPETPGRRGADRARAVRCPPPRCPGCGPARSGCTRSTWTSTPASPTCRTTCARPSSTTWPPPSGATGLSLRPAAVRGRCPHLASGRLGRRRAGRGERYLPSLAA